MAGRTLFIEDSAWHRSNVPAGEPEAPTQFVVERSFDLLLHEVEVDALPPDSRQPSPDPTPSAN